LVSINIRYDARIMHSPNKINKSRIFILLKHKFMGANAQIRALPALPALGLRRPVIFITFLFFIS